MSLKVYYDLMSQPSRALYILLKTSKCNFEPKLVDLRRLEHHSEEYTKVNRLQKVPVIDHNGFVLSESIAIIRYLSGAGLIPPSLYPRDLKQQARVDEFLEWHHIGLRLHCSMYFRYVYLDPIITGVKPEPKTSASYERRMRNALQEFDTLWLGRGTDFILGNSPTVADIWAACELEQPRIIGFDAKDSYPNIAAWWPKLVAALEPNYSEAHVIVNKVGKKVRQMNSKI